MSDQVRIAYMGAFLGKEQAEDYRAEFYDGFEDDIASDNLVVIQDDIVFINSHWVVRIMAQNPQLELDLEEEKND